MKRSDFLKRSALIAGTVVVFKELPKAEEEAFASLTPLPEGSTIPLMGGGDRWAVEYGFQNAAELPWHLEKFDPKLLRRSLPLSPAHSTEITWPGGGNTSQIIRTPFSRTNAQWSAAPSGERDAWWGQVTRQALKSHLKAVEEILEHGQRKRWAANRGEHMGIYRVGQMAGSRQLLGRLPRSKDTFVLRPLRDLVLFKNRQANDADMITDEWLSEITLEAHR